MRTWRRQAIRWRRSRSRAASTRIEATMATKHRPTTAARKRGAAKPQRWSQHVTETSDALDLEHGVFARADPASIARSLKRSAERSQRRKADPFRSAMSMLVFYIN